MKREKEGIFLGIFGPVRWFCSFGMVEDHCCMVFSGGCEKNDNFAGLGMLAVGVFGQRLGMLEGENQKC